ncbi:hypothetical protein ID866_1093 [Astraeus odoratus]|nr:hypothetical protein ID866_1093 [Astraeus odoratus]
MDAACFRWFTRPSLQDSPQEGRDVITFSVGGLTGVAVGDILRGNAAIDKPYDHILNKLGEGCIILSLQWPGYTSVALQKARHAKIDTWTGEEPITRQELAREICGLLCAFYRIASVSTAAYPVHSCRI